MDSVFLWYDFTNSFSFFDLERKFKMAFSLTFSQHAHGTTLPQTAVLTLPPHVHVHLTASATLAAIHCLLGHAPPEEAWNTGGWMGQRSAHRGQHTEVSTQRSAHRGQHTEVRTQRSAHRGQHTEVSTVPWRGEEYSWSDTDG